MEEYYDSTCWTVADAGTVTRPDGKEIPYTWDRLNTVLSPWPLSWSTWWANGDAICGTGYHAVGKLANINGDIWGAARGAAAAIDQTFDWPGGTLYWRMSARGKFARVLPGVPPGKALAYIYGGTAGSSSEQRFELLNQSDLTVAWQTFNGSVDLPAGTYNVRLDSWDKVRFFNTSLADDGAVYYDDVFFSAAQVGVACSDNQIETTPTPGPSVTPTIDASLTPIATWTPTVAPGEWTPTPDGSPTPTNMPDMLNVWNCGFEASAIWQFNSKSTVGLAGGPTGPQYANATGPWPAVAQTIITSRDGPVYFTAWTKGDAYIRLVNFDTLQTVDVYRGNNYSWYKVMTSFALPAGRWRLELNSANPQSGAAQYDGITMSFNSFATGNQSWCALEPTPGPTAFITATPTPTGTIGPSSTPKPSNTPLASFTPYPIWTPGPTSTPGPGDLTATAAQATSTAQGTPPGFGGTQTAAALGTATAQGTPGASTGTPGPGVGTPGGPGWQFPPQQPPGGQDASCIRPDSWNVLNIAWWVDYEMCEGKAFISWGDGNNQQVQNIWQNIQGREPFGTLGEINDAMGQMQVIVNSYNWSNTGMPGVKNAPNPTIFWNPSNPYNGTRIDLNNAGAPYRINCDLSINQVMGYQLGQPICFIWDILYRNNLLPWLQFFVNGCSILALVFYFRNNFLKPAS